MVAGPAGQDSWSNLPSCWRSLFPCPALTCGVDYVCPPGETLVEDAECSTDPCGDGDCCVAGEWAGIGCGDVGVRHVLGLTYADLAARCRSSYARLLTASAHHDPWLLAPSRPPFPCPALTCGVDYVCPSGETLVEDAECTDPCGDADCCVAGEWAGIGCGNVGERHVSGLTYADLAARCRSSYARLLTLRPTMTPGCLLPPGFPAPAVSMPSFDVRRGLRLSVWRNVGRGRRVQHGPMR